METIITFGLIRWCTFSSTGIREGWRPLPCAVFSLGCGRDYSGNESAVTPWFVLPIHILYLRHYIYVFFWWHGNAQQAVLCMSLY